MGVGICLFIRLIVSSFWLQSHILHSGYRVIFYILLTESYRKGLHHLLGLPADQPLLRRNVAYRFPGDAATDGYLTNTHVGLPPSAGRHDLISFIENLVYFQYCIILIVTTQYNNCKLPNITEPEQRCRL